MDGNRVLTLGTFDILHSGHLWLLKVCSMVAGDGEVIVGVNTDEFVSEYKPSPPILTLAERTDMLQATMYVDRVYPNPGGNEQKGLISLLKPAFIVVGDEWSSRDYYGQLGLTKEWLFKQNITVLYAAHPGTMMPHTSDIKKRITG